MLRIIAKFLWIIFILKKAYGTEANKVFHVSLTGDNAVKLHWMVDYYSETLQFEVHFPSEYKWLGIGFSDRGELYPADFCFFYEDLRGKIKLKDVTADFKGVLAEDSHQNCKYFKFKKIRGITKFTFKRKFDTCDKSDYIIEDGTTHIVWVRGKHNLLKINGLNISSNQDDHGMVRINLLKNLNVEGELPNHLSILDVATQQVKVPSEETTYWCHVFKLPKEFTKKHHIYQYEANVQESSHGLVHHMEVFHCETDPSAEIPLYTGNCFSENRPKATTVCKRVLAAWAMGAPPFIYPKEASLPLGGENFNPYIMLEVHYNNPGHMKGMVDSSGIRFYVSPKLKEMDAGVMELGLEYTDKMAIPPKQELFHLTGYCTSDCTSMGLPATGITVFGSQLHTHLTGVRVYTRHFDAYGNELPELNRDNHFSTHFQEIRRLKRPTKVLPGHVLITRCEYNTENRENITLGGFGISDEMCVNYIHYYPHSELEVCKSSISDQALQTYFNYMKEWEGQDTSWEKPISENYKAIKWNRMRVQLLNDVYGEAPLSMQCNMSSGDRFPGYWENVHIPPILKPLPPQPRHCDNIH